jgi:hypothetical protein
MQAKSRCCGEGGLTLSALATPPEKVRRVLEVGAPGRVRVGLGAIQPSLGLLVLFFLVVIVIVIVVIVV